MFSVFGPLGKRRTRSAGAASGRLYRWHLRLSPKSPAEDWHALAMAGEGPRNDRQIVLKAVSKDGRALEVASEPLKNDLEVVLEAVSEDR